MNTVEKYCVCVAGVVNAKKNAFNKAFKKCQHSKSEIRVLSSVFYHVTTIDVKQNTPWPDNKECV